VEKVFTEEIRRNEALKRQVAALEKNLEEEDVNFLYAVDKATSLIHRRDSEIESLARQLRGIGHDPCNEMSVEDKAWEARFCQLFKDLSCWAKKHYKFPTRAVVPFGIHTRLLEICHDSTTLSDLMNNQETKFLVVLSFAARWLVDEIFTPGFFAGVVKSFAKSDSEGKITDGFYEAMAMAKGILRILPPEIEHQC
jgi:hypothetical protein